MLSERNDEGERIRDGPRPQAAGRASDRLKVAVAQAEPPDEAGRPSAQAERREQGETVRAAVRRLPGAQREAVAMAYWGGLTADPDSGGSLSPAHA